MIIHAGTEGKDYYLLLLFIVIQEQSTVFVQWHIMV